LFKLFSFKSCFNSFSNLGDKAFQKKVLCIKVAYRHYTQTAVSDIIIVKSKRAPIGYSYLGEINGFNLCIKFSQIPTASGIGNQFLGGQQPIRHSASFSQPHPPPRPPRPLSSATANSDNSIGYLNLLNSYVFFHLFNKNMITNSFN
jgi:hypothetical protein